MVIIYHKNGRGRLLLWVLSPLGKSLATGSGIDEREMCHRESQAAEMSPSPKQKNQLIAHFWLHGSRNQVDWYAAGQALRGTRGFLFNGRRHRETSPPALAMVSSSCLRPLPDARSLVGKNPFAQIGGPKHINRTLYFHLPPPHRGAAAHGALLPPHAPNRFQNLINDDHVTERPPSLPRLFLPMKARRLRSIQTAARKDEARRRATREQIGTDRHPLSGCLNRRAQASPPPPKYPHDRD